jgi:hypothetical protein
VISFIHVHFGKVSVEGQGTGSHPDRGKSPVQNASSFWNQVGTQHPSHQQALAFWLAAVGFFFGIESPQKPLFGKSHRPLPWKSSVSTREDILWRTKRLPAGCDASRIVAVFPTRAAVGLVATHVGRNLAAAFFFLSAVFPRPVSQ